MDVDKKSKTALKLLTKFWNGTKKGRSTCRHAWTNAATSHLLLFPWMYSLVEKLHSLYVSSPPSSQRDGPFGKRGIARIDTGGYKKRLAQI
jgi:hypothetical protein